MALSNDVVFLVNDGVDNKKLKHSSLKTDLEGTFLPLTGGSMSGPLVVQDPTNINDASTKRYVDDEIFVIKEQIDDAIESVTDGTFKYILGTGSAPTSTEFYFANGTDYTPLIGDVKEIYISKTNLEGQTVTFADVIDGTYLRFNFSGNLYLFLCNTDPTFNTDYVLFNVDLIEADGATPSANDQAVVTTLHINGIDVNDLEQQFDTRYVKLSSSTPQDITSNITLGTDKITLDASNGIATFDGGIVSGSASNQGYLTTSGNGTTHGYIFADNSNGNGSAALNFKDSNNNGAAFIASDGSDNEIAKIDWFGRGTFKGQVEIGNDISSASGTRIYNSGSVYVRNDATQLGEAVWKAYNGGFGDANVTSAIYQDGSAEFAGGITVGGNPTFGANIGSQIQSAGVVNGCRAGSLAVWYGWQEGNTTETSAINADGSAEFATGSAKISNVGKLEITRGGADPIAADNNPSVEIRGRVANTAVGWYTPLGIYLGEDNVATTSNRNISINNDGTSLFKGNLVVDTSDSSLSDYAGDFTNNKNGPKWQAAVVGRNKAVGGPVWAGLANNFNANNAGVTSQIFEDGSASFAGGITTEDNIAVSRTLGTSACYVAQLNGVDAASINADGSAEFKGDVYAEKQFRTQNGYGAADSAVLGVVVEGADGTANASIGYDGSASFAGRVDCGDNNLVDVAIKAENNSTTATVYAQQFNDSGGVWSGRNKNNIETSWIDVTGSAQFKGRITIGDYDGSKGNLLYADGGIVSRRIDDSQRLFVGLDGVKETFTVARDGSATFEGRVTSKYSLECQPPDDAYYALSIKNSAGSQSAYVEASGHATFASVNGASVLIQTEADDVTKYHSATDSEGVQINVYNGAVIDVKDRLQKTDAALQSLKTAAAASTDFDTLKAAILDALTNL